jgi:hypothetical protein
MTMLILAYKKLSTMKFFPYYMSSIFPRLGTQNVVGFIVLTVQFMYSDPIPCDIDLDPVEALTWLICCHIIKFQWSGSWCSIHIHVICCNFLHSEETCMDPTNNEFPVWHQIGCPSCVLWIILPSSFLNKKLMISS